MINALILSLLMSQAPQHADQACLIANTAVDVRMNGQHVLIDAPYREIYEEDMPLPAEVLEMVETGQGAYADVDALLISHGHKDHFSAEAIARMAQHLPQLKIVGNTEMDQALANILPTEQRLAHEKGATAPYVYRLEGLTITALPFTHGRGNEDVDNLAFLLVGEHTRLLHLGDSFASFEDVADLISEPIVVDVLFAPWWYMLKEENFAELLRMVDAKTIIPTHMPNPNVPFAPFDRVGGHDAARAIIGARDPRIHFNGAGC